MKVLALSDEICKALYDHYVPGMLKDYNLILACGDLNADYLSFIVTMARCPVLYVHGNHDESYEVNPPLGCDCVEDIIVVYKGLRILGLGGCVKYRPGEHQFTEKQMQKRIRKLKKKLKKYGGVDIVLSHAPVAGYGDLPDVAHKGFECFRDFIDAYHPRYWIHGHVHKSYDHTMERVHRCGDTTIINACSRYEFEIDESSFEPCTLKGELPYVF